MSMVFVCDQCETELPTGMMACPQCKEPFEKPVPDIAHYDETVPDDAILSYSARRELVGPEILPPPAAIALDPTLPPDPSPVPLPKMPPADHIGRTVTISIVVILVACLFWLWRNGVFGPSGGYLPPSVSHLLGH